MNTLIFSLIGLSLTLNILFIFMAVVHHDALMKLNNFVIKLDQDTYNAEQGLLEIQRKEKEILGITYTGMIDSVHHIANINQTVNEIIDQGHFTKIQKMDININIQ